MDLKELILTIKRAGIPVTHGTAAGMANFFEQYPEGVYILRQAGAAVPGWESFLAAGGREVLQAVERLVRNAAGRIEWTRIGGRYALAFHSRMTGSGVGAFRVQPAGPDPTWLNFTMPEGGVVTLNKVGSPANVTLEYSLDNGKTWQIWEEVGTARTLTLEAGQTMHVRNTSETSTRFSISTSNYYNFALSSTTYAAGNTNSLLCRYPERATLATYCYAYMLNGCTSLATAPELPATTLANNCYNQLFRSCYKIDRIVLHATDISASGCLANWLYGVSNTGDFYCDPNLDIPVGASGIPSGWTRHDIAEWQGE